MKPLQRVNLRMVVGAYSWTFMEPSRICRDMRLSYHRISLPVSLYDPTKFFRSLMVSNMEQY